MKRSPAADMTTGNVTRHILRFALPLLVGNIFQQFYNAAIRRIQAEIFCGLEPDIDTGPDLVL